MYHVLFVMSIFLQLSTEILCTTLLRFPCFFNVFMAFVAAALGVSVKHRKKPPDLRLFVSHKPRKHNGFFHCICTVRESARFASVRSRVRVPYSPLHAGRPYMDARCSFLFLEFLEVFLYCGFHFAHFSRWLYRLCRIFRHDCFFRYFLLCCAGLCCP